MYLYLLIKKTYTNNVIASTVKFTLHYFFLRKSLIFICLVAPFLFKLNNKLPIFTMSAWSLSNTGDKLRTKLNEIAKWNETLTYGQAAWPGSRHPLSPPAAHCVADKTRARSLCTTHSQPYRVKTAACYTTFQKHKSLLLLPMRTNICVWCCSFLKMINPWLTFVRTKNSDQ
jgi:hypothetical protein